MKKTFLALSGALMIVSNFASATSLKPVLQLEKVTVKNLELIGNFMPPLPPGGVIPMAILTVNVDSNGCTDERDFDVQVKTVAGGKQLTVVRKEPDVCKAYFPEGKEVKLRVQGLGFGANVFIANPIRVEDRTSH